MDNNPKIIALSEDPHQLKVVQVVKVVDPVVVILAEEVMAEETVVEAVEISILAK